MQVIGARRKGRVPRIPGRCPQGCVELIPQFHDQGCECRGLPRLPADQRITRIPRRRLGNNRKSFPKLSPLAWRNGTLPTVQQSRSATESQGARMFTSLGLTPVPAIYPR